MRRKGYAPHYVPANIAKFQPEMHDPTLELVSVRSLPITGNPAKQIIDPR